MFKHDGQRIREIIYSENTVTHLRLDYLEKVHSESITRTWDMQNALDALKANKVDTDFALTCLRIQNIEQNKCITDLTNRLAALEPHEHICKTCEVKI
jgi:hypothetical protein